MNPSKDGRTELAEIDNNRQPLNSACFNMTESFEPLAWLSEVLISKMKKKRRENTRRMKESTLPYAVT